MSCAAGRGCGSAGGLLSPQNLPSAQSERPSGAYVNVPNAAASNWEREYYGSNRERLRRVKAKYDPENVFSFEQSVPLVAG